MKELNNELNEIIKSANVDLRIINKIENKKEIFPFDKKSRILAYLLSTNTITYKKYLKLDSDYCKRNKYLELFEMSPRTYGQTWGEKHLRSLFPEFIKATKNNLKKLNIAFDGEFDLWIDGIRIEVKACRANNIKVFGNLASRAYLYSEAKDAKFKYHFQQIKPSCCDIFIWIGTCRDKLLYWILTSDELKETHKLSPQHRNENTGNTNNEIFEGQVFMTEEELLPYLVDENDILKVVREKGNKVLMEKEKIFM